MKQRLLALCALLCGLTPLVLAQDAPRWWQETTWYLLFVRSFYDSDGDGIGDLRGVIEKLDYLNDGDPSTSTDLGVTGLWLLPIHEAASYHGYDTTDYYAVEQDYGSAEDFKALVAAAHARGMKIILDLVINHTSSQHPWFIESVQGNAPYDDYYVWFDQDPGWEGPNGQQVIYPRGGRFYYSAFWSEMPDLNYENEAVRAMMQDVTRYWLEEFGVDGFRVDAAKYAREEVINERPLLSNSPANRQWLADLNAYVKTVNPEAYVIAEVWDSTFIASKYVGGRSADQVFEFELARFALGAARSENSNDLRGVLQSVLTSYPLNTYANFLSNHDMARSLTQLDGDLARARTAAALLFTLPGTPYLYYGEELGLEGQRANIANALADAPMRAPMPWDASLPNAGFSSATPWFALGAEANTRHVAAATSDPAALWAHYRDLIALRSSTPALSRGAALLVDSRDAGVFALLRYTLDDVLLVLVNLSGEATSDYALALGQVPIGLKERTATLVWGAGTPQAPTLNANGGFSDYLPLAELPPHSLSIVRLR